MWRDRPTTQLRTMRRLGVCRGQEGLLDRYAYEDDLVADLVAELPTAGLLGPPPVAMWQEVVFSTRVVDVVTLTGVSSPHAPFSGLVGLGDTELLVLAAVASREPISMQRLCLMLGIHDGRKPPKSVRRLLERGLLVEDPRALRTPLRDALAECEVTAIEAKLSKHREVLRQATENLEIADRSFVAVPVHFSFKDGFLQDCRRAGVGVLGVDPSGVFALVPASRTRRRRKSIVHNHLALRLIQEHLVGRGRWATKTGGTT